MSSFISPLQVLSVPEVAFHRQCFEHFSTHADKTALIDGATGKEYTYRDIIIKSKTVGSGLAKLGVQKGDMFALYSYNNTEVVIMMFAVFCTGATVTSVNPAHTAYELNDQLVDSSAKFVYTSNDKIETVLQATIDIIPRQNIVVSSFHDNLISLENLAQDDCSRWKDLETMEFNTKEDLLILLYSSGTTGRPKGVPRTLHNVLYQSVQRRHPEIQAQQTPVTSIVTAPLYHGYAFMTFISGNMADGAKLILQNKIDPESFFKAVEIFKVTHLYLLSSDIVALAKSPFTYKFNCSNLQHVYSAGAPLSKEASSTFCSNMGINHVKQVYGSSESGSISIDIYNKIPKEGSVGVLLPGLEAKVIDVNDGTSLRSGESGELCVKGQQVMKEYWKRPEETRAAIDLNGWFHTGDVVYYDEDKYIFIVDRIKDIFKVYDYQVSPTELEGVLFTHPAVLDVGVVGLPDESSINRPKAFVVKKAGAEVTEKELCEYIEGISTKYKWLTGGVEFILKIPRLPSGKIIRRQLQEMATKSMEEK